MGEIMLRAVFFDQFRPLCRRISVGVTGALTLSLVVAVSSPAVAAPPKLPKPPQEKVIPHTDAVLAHPQETAPPPASPAQATAWPAAGEADVALPRAVVPESSRRADLGAAIAGPRQAGNLPVL